MKDGIVELGGINLRGSILELIPYKSVLTPGEVLDLIKDLYRWSPEEKLPSELKVKIELNNLCEEGILERTRQAMALPGDFRYYLKYKYLAGREGDK